MKSFWVLKGLKILVLMAFFILLLGSVVMWLWNWLMPDLFNLPIISFGQAVGLTALTRILAGGFRLGAGAAGNKEHWEQKRQMWEKWSAMTPDERHKWKSEWRDRCRHSRPMGFKRQEEESGGNQI